MLTEYTKRTTALTASARGSLYPHVTGQAYLTKPQREGRLISVAAIETSPLLRAADLVVGKVASGESSPEWGIRAVENAQFLWLHRDYLRAIHTNIKIWNAPAMESVL